MKEFCPNKASKEYKELESIFGKKKAYFLWMRNKGNHLDKAPNGAESKLFLTLLEHFKGDRTEALKAKAKVYSNDFWNWFGNWTAEDKDNVSKVVDENGEPLITYHTTQSPRLIDDVIKDYEQHEYEDIRGIVTLLIRPNAIYTSSDKIISSSYAPSEQMLADAFELNNINQEEHRAEEWALMKESVYDEAYNKIHGHGNMLPLTLEEEEKIDLLVKLQFDDSKRNEYIWPTNPYDFNSDKLIGSQYALYTNIKHPLIIDAKGSNWNRILYNGKIYSTRDLEESARISGYDGVIIKNVVDFGPFVRWETETPISTVIESFSSNQVKSAVSNKQDIVTGESGFSTTDVNIYYSLSGPKTYQKRDCISELLSAKLIRQSPSGRYYIIGNSPETRQYIILRSKYFGIQPTIYSNGQVDLFSNIEKTSNKKDAIEREFTVDHAIIGTIIDHLSKKFPDLNVTWLEEEEIPSNIHQNAKCFVKGNTVYLIRNRITSDTVIEEFLHPLMLEVYSTNVSIFYDLVEQAKKEFPVLWAQILDTYTNKEGFSDFNRDCEIVTQVLSRYTRVGFKSNKHNKPLFELIKNAMTIIKNFIIRAFGSNGKIDISSLPKMKLHEFSDMIIANDTRFDIRTTEDILYSISARAKSDLEIAEGITKRFNVLYKAFEKIPNKSAERQLTQNKIFELYNELQEHLDLSSVRIALDFALGSIGTLDENGVPTSLRSILGYLYDQSNKQQPYSGITPLTLVDMYLNSIGFYDNLLNNYIPNNLNSRLSQEDRQKITKLTESINAAKSMWTLAMVVVGDKIVDQLIDNEVDADDIDKDNMKIVAKDWLHKNVMYGDLNTFVSYVFNYGYSPDPIIKQAFHLILHAETKTLEEMHPIGQKVAKAYRKANKLLSSIGVNWQTILREHDVDGIPTGNFVRPVNYGLYEKDLEQFIKDLNEEFINDKNIKHTYIDDGNGIIINSLTKELADDEEWVGDVEPTYVKYLKRIEQFKCERAHRRYTYKYYEERLSKPYRGSLDPNDVDVNKFGHGLSPKTLSRYNHILSNINYYLDKCTDPDTGLAYPEKLNDQDKKSLDAWRDALDKLSNPYNDDMTPKSDDELQMAFEIRAWLKWLGERLQTTVDLDDYVNELTKLLNEAASTGDYKAVNDFIKYNSRIGINPDFINQTIGKFSSSHPQDQEVIHAHYLKSALQSMVKTTNGYTRDLSIMENKPEFWLRCKKIDQIIEDGKTPGSPDFTKELNDNFTFDPILYRDAYGRAIDSTGNPVKPEDEGMHNDLLTYQLYLINKYTNQALNSPTRTILGLVDGNGDPIVFNGTPLEVKKVMEKLFSYRRLTINDDGSITLDYVPLTIFSMMTPKHDSFYNTRTLRLERTILQVPTGRFAEKLDTTGIYINNKYNKSDLNAEQPRLDYIDSNGRNRYDNSEAWDRVDKNKYVKELYDILILTMQDALNNYSTKNRRFNYRLPLINADGMQLMSRLIKNGFKDTAKALFDAMTSVEENDESMRTADDYITGPDGSVATDIPLKYVRKLKDPSRLTTDVVGSVILFANMALNYKNKTEIDALLKTLRYNLDPNFRQNVELLKGEFSPADNEKQLSMFDSMMNKHMYNNLWATKPQEGPNSKATVAWNKLMRKVHRLETTQMLGLNLFSMLVGFGDSSFRIIKESLMGKYMTPIDSLVSLTDCIIHTPQILLNIGNPVANNKITRAMQLNGVSKGIHQTFEHTNYGRGRKVFYNIIMGGFSLLDWMANSLLLRSFYNNIRLYKGGVVETGFYSLYELELEFVKAGHSKKEALLAHTMSTRTLWGAYDDNMLLKPEFSQEFLKDENGNTIKKNPDFICHVPQKTKTRVRTKTLLRAALYNGMNPDNDQPRYKQSIVGNFVGAMRGWLTQAILHLFAGSSDNIVRQVEDVNTPEVKGTKTKMKSKHVIEPLTDEQRSRRMSWNYETGTPNDQIYVGMCRAFKTLYRKLLRYATLGLIKTKLAVNVGDQYANKRKYVDTKNKLSKTKFSYVEKYAWRDALIYMGVLAACMIAWPMLNEQAAAVPPPKDREEAGPIGISDIGDWFANQYIGDLYWKMQASDIGFRVIEAQITSIDPTSAMDVLNSITTLNSGLDDHIGMLKAISDVTGFSGHSLDEEVKQGGYKYYTRGERAFYKALGPLDNIHTAFSYWGIKKNQEFYTNTYGGIYRWFGYDFKHEKKNGGDFEFESFGSESFGNEAFGTEEF